MEYPNDFDAFDSVASSVAPPPNKVKPIKPSKEDLYAYYHDGLVPPKPLDKRYSFSKIKKILENEYDLVIWESTEYKGTRWYGKSPRKSYIVFDKKGNTIIENGYLHDIGKYLEEQGDYVSNKDIYADDDVLDKCYKADIYFVDWYGKPGHFKPNDKFYRNIYIEEKGCFVYIYDVDGNLIKRKKKDSEGLKIIRRDNNEGG